jgi:hypothetical protein
MVTRIEATRPCRGTEKVLEHLLTSLTLGRLRPGDRVASVRRLADITGLNRKTVHRAYGALIKEGFLDARPGAGTFVAGSAFGRHVVSLRDLQRLEVHGKLRAGGLGLYLLVDVQDLPVGADVERPPVGEPDTGHEDAVGVVGGDGEVGHVELADRITALTERFALGGSSPCERLREPSEDDGLSLELGETDEVLLA